MCARKHAAVPAWRTAKGHEGHSRGTAMSSPPWLLAFGFLLLLQSAWSCGTQRSTPSLCG